MSTQCTKKDSSGKSSLDKQDEKQDDEIMKLKNQAPEIDGDSDAESEIDVKVISSDSASSREMPSGSCPTEPKESIVSGARENFLTLSYLMWENCSNICWLDASMSLLVHNRSLRRLLCDRASSQVGKIIEKYDEAISLLNDFSNPNNIEIRMLKAKVMLKEIQESSLKYLQPKLKYKAGEPDSAFCSLYNLIAEDRTVKNFFEVEFKSVLECQKCKSQRTIKHKKPIITLSKVAAFQPSAPVSVCQCPSCKTPDQSLVVKYSNLPQCLIFHFESGAGKGELMSLDFMLNERMYKLTGVMVLEKNKDSDLNHFLTWIRDPDTDSWLECNDLNSDILSFSVVPPFIELEDVYIIMYEASDSKGTLLNKPLTVTAEEEKDFEDVSKSNSNIPFINLSDEETESSANIEEGSKSSDCSAHKDKEIKNSENITLIENTLKLKAHNSEHAGQEIPESPSKNNAKHPSLKTKMVIENKRGIGMPTGTSFVASQVSKENEIISDRKLKRGLAETSEDQLSCISSKVVEETPSNSTAAFKCNTLLENINRLLSGTIEEKYETASKRTRILSDPSNITFVQNQPKDKIYNDITVTKLTEKSGTPLEKTKMIIPGSIKKSLSVPEMETALNESQIVATKTSQVIPVQNTNSAFTVTRIPENSSSTNLSHKQKSAPDYILKKLDVSRSKDHNESNILPVEDQSKGIVGDSSAVSSMGVSKPTLRKNKNRNRKQHNRKKITKVKENSVNVSEIDNSEDKLAEEILDVKPKELADIIIHSPNCSKLSKTHLKDTAEASKAHFHQKNNFDLLNVENSTEKNKKHSTVSELQNISKDVTLTRRSLRKRKFTPKIIESLDVGAQKNESNKIKLPANFEVGEKMKLNDNKISANEISVSVVGDQSKMVQSTQGENVPVVSMEAVIQPLNVISQVQQVSIISTNQVMSLHASKLENAEKCPNLPSNSSQNCDKTVLSVEDEKNLGPEIKSTVIPENDIADGKEVKTEECEDITLPQCNKNNECFADKPSDSLDLKSSALSLDVNVGTKSVDSNVMPTKSIAQSATVRVRRKKPTPNVSVNRTLRRRVSVHSSDEGGSKNKVESVKVPLQTLENHTIQLRSSSKSSPKHIQIQDKRAFSPTTNKKNKYQGSENVCNSIYSNPEAKNGEASCKIDLSPSSTSKETKPHIVETKHLFNLGWSNTKFAIKDVRVRLEKLDEETLKAELSGKGRQSTNSFLSDENIVPKLNSEVKGLFSSKAMRVQNSNDKLAPIQMLPEKFLLTSSLAKRILDEKDVPKDQNSVVKPNQERSRSRKPSIASTSESVNEKVVSGVNSVSKQNSVGSMKALPTDISFRLRSRVRTNSTSNSILSSDDEGNTKSRQSSNLTGQTNTELQKILPKQCNSISPMKDDSSSVKTLHSNVSFKLRPEVRIKNISNSVLSSHDEGNTKSRQSSISTQQTNTELQKILPQQCNSISSMKDDSSSVKALHSNVSFKMRPVVRINNISNSVLSSDDGRNIKHRRCVVLTEQPGAEPKKFVPKDSYSISPSNKGENSKPGSTIAVLLPGNLNLFTSQQLKRKIETELTISAGDVENKPVHLSASKSENSLVNSIKNYSRIQPHCLSTTDVGPDVSIPSESCSSKSLASKTDLSESVGKGISNEVPSEGRFDTISVNLSQSNSHVGSSALVNSNVSLKRSKSDLENIIQKGLIQNETKDEEKSLEVKTGVPNLNCQEITSGYVIPASKAEPVAIPKSIKENTKSTSVSITNNQSLSAPSFQLTNATSPRKAQPSCKNSFNEITKISGEVHGNCDTLMSPHDSTPAEIEGGVNINAKNSVRKRNFPEVLNKQEENSSVCVDQSNTVSDLKSNPGRRISPIKRRRVSTANIALDVRNHKADASSCTSSELNVSLPSLNITNSSSRSALSSTSQISTENKCSYAEASVADRITSRTKKMTNKKNSVPKKCKPNCDCNSLGQVEIVQGMCELFYKEIYTYFRFGSK